MAKYLYEITAIFTVEADSEEEVWELWAKDKVTYDCIHSIDIIEELESDEEEE